MSSYSVPTMRSIFTYLLALLALVFLLPTSCKPDSDVEEATLELSPSTLNFTKDGGEQVVTITTNRENWSAFSPQEDAWVKLKEEGSTLRVSVPANPRSEERTTSVIVNAGGVQRRIAIRQSAGEASLTLEQTVTFGLEGGSHLITFAEASADAKAELAVPTDWLSISAASAKGFTLIAKANATKLRRAAKVNVIRGNSIQEIEVVQEGLPTTLLPLLEFPADLYQVIRYEQGRGHILLESVNGGEDEPSVYRFLTKDKTVPFIQYTFNVPLSPGFMSAETLFFGFNPKEDVPALEAYLKDHGFTLSKSTDQMAVYTSTTIPVSLQTYYFSDGVKLEFTYQPQQPQAYKTFTTLPMTRMTAYMGNRELNKAGKKRAEIRKDEEALGSEYFDVGDPSADVYQVKKSFDGEDVRAYLFVVANPDKGIAEDDPYIDVCVGVNAFFPITMGYWQDKITGKHYLTNEVRSFFAGVGYPYLGKLKNGDYAFYNKERLQVYVLRAVDDGATQVLQVQSIYAKVKSANASLASQLDYRASVKQRREDLRRLSELVAPRALRRASH